MKIAQGVRVNSRRRVRMRAERYIDNLAEGLSVQLVEAFEEARPGLLDSLNDWQLAAFLERIEIRTRAYLRRNL